MNIQRLVKILSLNRAHGSPGISELYRTVLAPYKPTLYQDDKGNPLAYVIQRGESKTLFSGHIDTAEKWDGQLRRKVRFGPNGILKSDGTHVLGADNGCGLAIMLHMIDRNIPGTYVMTFGEEIGGIGAKGMERCHADFLAQFDRAVAFDRRGTSSIITHMMVGKVCSDEFAEALGQALSDDTYMLCSDDTGSYTDTADYAGIIGEATNISSGYQMEHGPNETLDLNYLAWLAERVCQIDWETLPVVRKPGDTGEVWGRNPWGGFGSTSKNRYDPNLYGPETHDDLWDMDYGTIVTWIENEDPRVVADMMLPMLEDLHREWKPKKSKPRLCDWRKSEKPFDIWEENNDPYDDYLRVGML